MAKPPKTTPDDHDQEITSYVTTGMKTWVKAYAEAQGISVAQVVRAALDGFRKQKGG